MKVKEVLREVDRLAERVQVLRDEANKLERKAEVLMRDYFGIESGDVLSPRKFIGTIVEILKKEESAEENGRKRQDE